MGYRNLMIESIASLTIKNEQLLITTNKTHSVPIEDINSVLIENRQTTISMGTLAKLSQNGVTVYICDDKHTPCGIMVPFAQHSRNTGVIKLQESLTVPTKKQLWQQIVKAKIANQAKCLEFLDKPNNALHLEALAKTVLSGDTTNVEATAANYYFKHLFATEFRRSNEDDSRNGFLNYGYAILRGHIARLIASYGFLPMKGLHHKSELNAYNLADDFLEPFRPVVDLYTARLANYSELTPRDKRGLYNLLNVDMLSGKQVHSVSYAAERLMQSFTRCCQKTSKELLLPSLVDLKQHTYE